MSDEELPPALAEAYSNRKPFGRGFEPRPSPRDRRSANGPLAALVTVYTLALCVSMILFFVGFAAFSSDPLGGTGTIGWAGSFGAIGILGGMLHLAVAAIRRVIEDSGA
ncbi:hypothetical protein [Leifsonia virtsii]|uniref:Integral membrane protein n=1 Tax=Leifsonia virtsii TaxID=3035915 RepID=A0ABT8IXS7_9MICO|nr:hypothetical protein [Leifsonia virtsii]MDN4596834.1 hypothetical protein [Leifsonia virtsii]